MLTQDKIMRILEEIRILQMEKGKHTKVEIRIFIKIRVIKCPIPVKILLLTASLSNFQKFLRL